MKYILFLLLGLANFSFAADTFNGDQLISEVKTVTLADGRTILAAENGLALYTFDVDTEGVSNCFGGCLTVWPALTTKKDSLPAPFSIFVRPDGVKHVLYHGEALYFFRGDSEEGHINGDNLNNVWHILVDRGDEVESDL